MRIACVALVIAALTLTGCKKNEGGGGGSGQGGAAFAGVVFDVGGRGDKSFNDSAYRGLERAQKELAVTVKYYEPREPSDRESGLRRYAGEGVSVIFGIGFMFSDQVEAMAKQFPKLKFACIDYNKASAPVNMSGIGFKEEEGSFLVGAIAGLCTQTGKIGFVGGMDIPLIHKFAAGFKAGVLKVKPDAKIMVNYCGTTAEAFKDASKGKQLSLGMYNDGVDIIFHASGQSGKGVFEAARETGKFAIGVDSDQYSEAPGRVLTSMIKNVDVAVFETIKSVKENKFESGIKVFGLKEGGVGYVYDDNNKSLISKEVIDKVETLKKEIIEGKIAVPSTDQ